MLRFYVVLLHTFVVSKNTIIKDKKRGRELTRPRSKALG